MATMALRPIRLFNTLTQAVEPLRPLEPGHVRLYSCGPTVHDFAHIGNFRTFVFNDVLRRTLKRFGYRVTQVMNITDVEDKIIAKARERGVAIEAITERYIADFHQDRVALGIEDAEHYPRATEHIEEMVRLVERLLERDLAYRADGSIYFRVGAFAGYGRLARLEPASLKTGARIESDEYDKENVQDFVLWKAAKPGELQWQTRIGPGRPGWHLECSAMASRYLGETIDLHTGGKDLVFPHHTNEIAQSEGASGEPFVRIWLHAEFLNEGDVKMSKSLGNITTARALIDAGIDPRVIRCALLKVHWRKPLQFGQDALDQATATIERLDSLRLRLATEARGQDPTELRRPAAQALEDFDQALADDLMVPEALAALHGFATSVNQALDRGQVSPEGARTALEALDAMDQVLGLARREAEAVPEAVAKLAASRAAAREARNWAEADRLRGEIERQGWVLEDTRDGTRLRPLSQSG
jgi:cysteinyl-tRNA synthetase